MTGVMHENRSKSVKVSEIDDPMSSVGDTDDVAIVSGSGGSGRDGIDHRIRSRKTHFAREFGSGSRTSSVSEDAESESEKNARENERSK